ncbi:hypothetical protein SynMITS9220_01592 [Synechococcus sp. MIT S9220]|nr:hypothetical protein SynMITS9220_01592 [Synechococcus sp. MIT S9220]
MSRYAYQSGVVWHTHGDKPVMAWVSRHSTGSSRCLHSYFCAHLSAEILGY